VIIEAHEAGTSSEPGMVRFTGLEATNLGIESRGGVKMVVGWKNSTCSVSDAGIEYRSVRMLVFPVLTWVKTENSAERRSFAWETGILISSMSPAGVIGLAPILFSESQLDTAASVSSVGLTNLATWQRQQTSKHIRPAKSWKSYLFEGQMLPVDCRTVREDGSEKLRTDIRTPGR
jgi:hypothetical protein